MFRKMNEGDLLSALYRNRRALIGLILNLSEGDLAKIGTHKKFGKLNIVQWVEFFVLHEAHHLYMIFQLANDIDLKTINEN